MRLHTFVRKSVGKIEKFFEILAAPYKIKHVFSSSHLCIYSYRRGKFQQFIMRMPTYLARLKASSINWPRVVGSCIIWRPLVGCYCRTKTLFSTLTTLQRGRKISKRSVQTFHSYNEFLPEPNNFLKFFLWCDLT